MTDTSTKHAPRKPRYRPNMLAHLYKDRANFDIEKLEKLLEAIGDWNHIVEKSLTTRFERLGDDDTKWSDFAREQIIDENHSHEDTMRMFYGGFAVTLTSTVEHYVASACRRFTFKKPPTEKASYKNLYDSLKDDVLGPHLDLQTLPGESLVAKAREIGNSYKHDGGKATAGRAVHLGFAKGKQVEYESYNWKEMIDAAHKFMYALADSIPDA